jgi:hypothetical protein
MYIESIFKVYSKSEEGHKEERGRWEDGKMGR